MSERDQAPTADVCVVGAGPHALAVAVHLKRAEPGIRLEVIDPSGSWLSIWHEQMARMQIATLRSPIVHSPSPDPSALSQHVARHGLPSSGLPYEVPTTEAFASFCHALIDDHEIPAPIESRANLVTPLGDGLEIETNDGVTSAHRVVIATNPHRRRIPDWVWPLVGHRPGMFEFASDVDLRSFPSLTGQNVVVLGGGLSAAHLACGAADRGAQVHLVARNRLTERSFDTDPGWLGPKRLQRFHAEPDANERLNMVRIARGGGTVPPWMLKRLGALADSGELTLHEGASVRAASIEGETCRVALDDHTTIDAHRVWLATGTTPDIGSERCLAHVVADVPVIEGLPITNDDLRIGHHEVYVTGRLATLALGPAAGNLWGARQAAERITRAICGRAARS